MIEARIILDSINPAGVRLTTWLLTYPRFIHSEFMTHRIFSRNSASSRAIPVDKQINAVRSNAATPEQWGKNQKGMQAEETLTPEDEESARGHWYRGMLDAVDRARSLADLGIHKQIANRIIEPWAHMTVLATATDHSNFFKLRAHPAAQPEFQVLAYRMLAAYLKSKPQGVEWGEWHLPGLEEDESLSISEKLKIVTALACRASYSAFEDGVSLTDAQRIHDRGIEFGHWSPFEHAAQAINDRGPHHPAFNRYPWSNFDWPGEGGPSGWGQYRKTFPQECARAMSGNELAGILNARPEWVKI